MMRLATQLYTVREQIRDRSGFASSLRRIADIGYAGVQLSAVGAMDTEVPAVSAREAGSLLADLGLHAVATHRPWSRLRDDTDREIAFHQELGCDFAAIGSLPNEYAVQGATGFRRFLEDAAPIVARLKDAGIRFGYHNHSHEFQTDSPAGRSTWFDTFVDLGGSDFHLEIDVYWAWHAGVDPALLLRRCRGRAPVIHLKDRCVGPDGPEIAAVGEGNLPWEGILSAAHDSGVEWLAVEQDTCRRDPFDCLASSFRFLSGRS